MSYTRDSANDLVWNEDNQSYVSSSVPFTLTEYTCNRDTTIDIYKSALDPDTIYNITDSQTNFINIIRDTIWPVGSLYLGMMEVCPLAALFGTWVKVSSGRVIQGADDNHLAGTTIEAGLPDVSHKHIDGFAGINATAAYGVSTTTDTGNVNQQNGTSTNYHAYTSTVSLSDLNPIYGKSTTVQPPAFCVNIWQRTA